jgi:hypothetical protein
MLEIIYCIEFFDVDELDIYLTPIYVIQGFQVVI